MRAGSAKRHDRRGFQITRMAELIDRKDRSMALKALASVTMIIAVISLFRLLGGAPPSLF